MEEHYLESAEFYNRRYSSFSVRVILPTFFLLIFVVLFSLFAKKEITITSGASIEPSKILANIQSTSNNAIVTNNLKENKVVKKGDLLVQYKSDSENTQKETFSSHVESLKEQKRQLELLQESLKTGTSQFSGEDRFGYEQAFNDYKNQAASIRSNTEQQNSTIASQNSAASNSQAELGNLINETNAKLADYQTLRNAIQNGTSVPSTNAGYSIYQAYEAQAAADSQGQLKSQVLSQIDSQISQFESALAGYRVQYAGSGAQQAYSGSLDSQLESLKAQQLTKVGQELTALNQKILEVENNLKVQGGITQKGMITATEDGILHLNPETAGANLVPEGKLLAQLYPVLTKEKKVVITTYVTSKDVASLKKGETLRFTAMDGNNKEFVLKSKISNIDNNATKTEKGNFFKVEAEISLTDAQAKKMRYGIEGRAVVITGSKTYFDYYLDQFLRRD